MKKYTYPLILFLTSFIWGLAFVSQSQATGTMGPLLYNGIRMLLGFLVLLPLLLLSLKKKNISYIKSVIKDGLICGLILGTASFFQQKGIEYTTAGKAGFITSLYILIVPLFSLILGNKITKRVWFCVILGLIGAFLLSFSGEGTIKGGDILVFISAIFFALHIIYVDKNGKAYSGADLSCIQFFFAGSIATLLSFIFENPTIISIKASLIPLLYGGIGSCGIAYTLQIVGQKHVEPTKATLILSLESVWAVVGGLIILNEEMKIIEIIGCIILFFSVVFAQLPEKKTNPSS